MATRISVDWYDKIWNPVTGCTPISEGCESCYARRMAYKLRGRCGYPEDEPFQVTLHPERLEEPLRWRKPWRIYMCSEGDLFHDLVPEEYIDSILEVIAACPQHTFFVLTKRPQNIDRKIYEPTNDVPCRTLGGGDYLPNLYLGVTVENQKAADERIPLLLQTPAATRFINVDPMLEPVDLSHWLTCLCNKFWPGQGHHLDCPTQKLHLIIHNGQLVTPNLKAGTSARQKGMMLNC